jgi:3-deoxy-D-manno-octulosonate 8-phosphate phosphatase (KDO 8-P phosphatase)
MALEQRTLLAKAQKIKLLILDVDGVLTDGRLFFDLEGIEYKGFHVRDGLGIKLLQKIGVEVAVISGRSSKMVSLRMKSLGLEHIYLGYENKITAFEQILEKIDIEPEQIAHVGDDLPDLPIMQRAGFAIAVNDAHFAVKQKADWSTDLPGGYGAVREVCDFIIHAQGRFDDILSFYWQ